MATHAQLASTIHYLCTAANADHRVPLQDGSSCPHCLGTRVQKWGRDCGRQRYRCRDCSRTFSTFTGTPLYRLKRPELWPRFLGCVEDRLSVRSAGKLLGVDKDTTLRWRHRLCDHWRQEPKPRLEGRLIIGDFCLPHADKGGRYLQRPPRHRGEPWGFPSCQTGPVTVLVALQDPLAWHTLARHPPVRRPPVRHPPARHSPVRHTSAQHPLARHTSARQPAARRAPARNSPPRCHPAMVLESVGARRIRPRDYDDRVGPRVRDVTEIVGSRGPYCPLATFARRLGVPYRSQNRSFFPAEVFLVRSGLRAWLRPFRGVSTRRLNNYLEWYRRRGMTLPDQRSTPTERYRGPPRGGEPPWRAPHRSRAARSLRQPGGT